MFRVLHLLFFQTNNVSGGYRGIRRPVSPAMAFVYIYIYIFCSPHDVVRTIVNSCCQREGMVRKKVVLGTLAHRAERSRDLEDAYIVGLSLLRALPDEPPPEDWNWGERKNERPKTGKGQRTIKIKARQGSEEKNGSHRLQLIENVTAFAVGSLSLSLFLSLSPSIVLLLESNSLRMGPSINTTNRVGKRGIC